jgi:hypothetical protein
VVIILFGISYIIYLSYNAAPHLALLHWLTFYLIFLKKELRPDMDALLNVGLGFYNVGLSMYNIIDVILIISMLVVFYNNKARRPLPPLSSGTKLLYYSFVAMAIVGLLHVGLVWLNIDILGNAGYDRLFIGIWPLLAGLVVFNFSRMFILSKKHVETIFLIGIVASLLLFIEFALVKYTNLMSEQFVYYSFNYRNSFRSFFQSGDLFVTLILAFGSAACLYYFITRKALIFLVMNGLFIVTGFYTYNRGSLLSILLMNTLVLGGVVLKNKNKILLGIMIGLLGISTFYMVQDYQVFETVEQEEAKDYSRGTEGFWGFGSLLTRTGASSRGLDVFWDNPFFGCGPGNMVAFMGTPKVPTHMDLGWLSSPALAEYYSIKSGERPTNAHNWYVGIMVEYGMVAILVLIFLGKTIYSNFRQFWKKFSLSGENRELSSLYLAQYCSFAFLAACALYYLFQAVPPIYGLLFLALRITLISGKEWLGAPVHLRHLG